MGFSSCQPVHARHCDGAGGRHDCRAAQGQPGAGRARGVGGGLTAALALWLWALAAQADVLRIATYNADLSAPGPGLLLHDLRKEDLPPQRAAVVAVIAALDADVLVLTGVDYDLRGEALDALERRRARPIPIVWR